MKFRYAYQNIVNLKATEKTQAQWMLSRELERLRTEETSLSQLQQQRKETMDTLHQAALNGASVLELQHLQLFLDRLEKMIQSKVKDVGEAQKRVQEKQQSLNHKAMDEKIWTKAKENALTEFTAQFLKKEQEELDELAAVRHG
ncbi:flagellar export protein FliJ [Marinicrinis lubricantis]|uniref:Flagellar FliJ protein n=1 Tax=Marinicrinis lubricantis TaxID=2086470 RepID=A0ABW1IMF7_9BACL